MLKTHPSLEKAKINKIPKKLCTQKVKLKIRDLYFHVLTGFEQRLTLSKQKDLLICNKQH